MVESLTNGKGCTDKGRASEGIGFFFENLWEATQTRRFLDERKGEGLYICLRESEAYTQFPRLATLKH